MEPGKREDRKSVGCERRVAVMVARWTMAYESYFPCLGRTFREKSNSEEILQILSEIADSLEQDLKRTGYSARTVVVKYKVGTMRCYKRKSIELIFEALSFCSCILTRVSICEEVRKTSFADVLPRSLHETMRRNEIHKQG